MFNSLEDLFCQFFSEHRVPHFCSPPWTSFRGCWKSAATAAHALILVKADGKHLWQVSIFSWHSAWGSFTPPVIVLFSEAARLSTALVIGWGLPWLCPSPCSQANPIPKGPLPETFLLRSPATDGAKWASARAHTHTHNMHIDLLFPPNTQPLVN